MRIYLDACCFNRPFDDPDVDRNRLEAEAVVSILNHVQEGSWTLIGSSALELELNQIRDRERREAVLGMLAAQAESIRPEQMEYDRAEEVMGIGIKAMDALHVACAESARCDVLLSTDDRFLRKAARYRSRLSVDVRNPLDWLLEQKP